MEIQAVFVARRGSGPIGEDRMSIGKGYAILEMKMRPPQGSRWRLAAGPGIGKAC
jgi:hypothetical protein